MKTASIEKMFTVSMPGYQILKCYVLLYSTLYIKKYREIKDIKTLLKTILIIEAGEILIAHFGIRIPIWKLFATIKRHHILILFIYDQ